MGGLFDPRIRFGMGWHDEVNSEDAARFSRRARSCNGKARRTTNSFFVGRRVLAGVFATFARNAPRPRFSPQEHSGGAAAGAERRATRGRGVVLAEHTGGRRGHRANPISKCRRAPTRIGVRLSFCLLGALGGPRCARREPASCSPRSAFQNGMAFEMRSEDAARFSRRARSATERREEQRTASFVGRRALAGVFATFARNAPRPRCSPQKYGAGAAEPGRSVSREGHEVQRKGAKNNEQLLLLVVAALQDSSRPSRETRRALAVHLSSMARAIPSSAPSLFTSVARHRAHHELFNQRDRSRRGASL